MTSQAVGLSPAPNVKQRSPENVQIPEISPQSLDIICLTCLKWVLNVIRLKRSWFLEYIYENQVQIPGGSLQLVTSEIIGLFFEVSLRQL